MPDLEDWLTGLASLLLPSTCVACGALTQAEAALCPHCALTLDPIDARRACPSCGLPGPDGDEEEAVAPRCLACVRAPPRWGAAAAPYVFGGALAVAVRRWKMGRRPELSRALGQLLAPAVLALPAAVDALVPVPLHPRRLREREFDQASLLARAAIPRRGVPVRDLLERTRDTPPQSALDAVARQRNMRGAFRCRPGVDLTGARLCLVDDVLTTGATASACARALLQSGAARVDVLTLARALP